MPATKPKGLRNQQHNQESDLQEFQLFFVWLKRIGFERYIKLRDNPFHLFLTHFLSGMFQGFGFVIGSTLVIALFFIVVNWLGGLPLIGRLVNELVKLVQENQSLH